MNRGSKLDDRADDSNSDAGYPYYQCQWHEAHRYIFQEMPMMKTPKNHVSLHLGVDWGAVYSRSSCIDLPGSARSDEGYARTFRFRCPRKRSAQKLPAMNEGAESLVRVIR